MGCNQGTVKKYMMEGDSPVPVVQGIVLGALYVVLIWMQQCGRWEFFEQQRVDGSNWWAGTTTATGVNKWFPFLRCVSYTYYSSLYEISRCIKIANLLDLSSSFWEVVINLKSLQLYLQAEKIRSSSLGNLVWLSCCPL